ncbi:MAG TPA: response regulator [Thermoanaerobaculia bacterium]|nr:response regulator [Thermoanaerobaculia bacterium]
MSHISLTLLGGFDARLSSGVSMRLPTRKGQALLAYLALRAGAMHSREKLASLLWGETGEEQARHSLRQTLVGIRKAIGEGSDSTLITHGDAVGLEATVEIDVPVFEKLVAEASPKSLARAADLYQGDFLEGFSVREEAFDEWMLRERQRLWELAVEALARLLRHQTHTRGYEAAVQTALRLLALDGSQEAVHRTLMRLYQLLGRREAAMRQYQTCVNTLRQELGVTPDGETDRLHRRILDNVNIIELENETRAGLPGEASILVVEDDAVTRALLQDFLRADGYQVTLAIDGTEALLHLGKGHFDAVLSDIHMPNLDGLKLLEIMGEQNITSPAIFLTALSDDELEVRGFELGAADYIRKPVRRDILLHRVRNAVRRNSARIGEPR